MVCMFYRSQAGYWSENGCKVISQYDKLQFRYVKCRCMHLSTFAVLMDLSDDVRSDTLE